MLWNVVKFREMLWKKAKCWEMLWKSISQHFITFHNILDPCGKSDQNLPVTPPKTSTSALEQQNVWTFAEKFVHSFFWASAECCEISNRQKPVNFGGPSEPQKGISQHFWSFTTFLEFPIISQHSSTQGGVRWKVAIMPFRLYHGSLDSSQTSRRYGQKRVVPKNDFSNWIWRSCLFIIMWFGSRIL